MPEPDTTLEVALEAVLARYEIPLYHLGPHDADRGDLSSDLAEAARKWIDVAVTIEPRINVPEGIRAGVVTWQPTSWVAGYEVTIDCEGKRAWEFYVGERKPDTPMLVVHMDGWERMRRRFEIGPAITRPKEADHG